MVVIFNLASQYKWEEEETGGADVMMTSPFEGGTGSTKKRARRKRKSRGKKRRKRGVVGKVTTGEEGEGKEEEAIVNWIKPLCEA